MKGGNLSASPTQIYDPLSTTMTDGSGRAPFAGNIIPSSRIDSGVRALLATGVWPDPKPAWHRGSRTWAEFSVLGESGK